MVLPDIHRVVTFGTSLTALGGWQKALAARLGEIHGHPVAVETVAKAGADSRWALQNVDRVTGLKPDVVLVEFAANDASILHGLRLSESRRNMIALVDRLRDGAPGALVFLMSMSPVWGRRKLIRPWLARYYEQHAKIARARGLGFIDHWPAWHRFSADELRRAIPDGGHPLAEVAARLIVPAIVAAMTGRSETQ